MLKIRLRRHGTKKQPIYRLVVAEADFKRDGRFVEIVGHYNPRTEPITYRLKEDRILHFMSNGAQPTDAVRRILGWSGTLERFDRLKQGESLEALLDEASAAAAAREATFDPRTRRDDLIAERNRRKAEREAAKAAAEEEAARLAAEAEAAAAAAAAEAEAAAAAAEEAEAAAEEEETAEEA